MIFIGYSKKKQKNKTHKKTPQKQNKTKQKTENVENIAFMSVLRIIAVPSGEL